MAMFQASDVRSFVGGFYFEVSFETESEEVSPGEINQSFTRVSGVVSQSEQMEFMQGTDIRIAAEHATFGLGEVRFGLVPTGGTHVRLPRQIPWAVAMELLLTGENIDARRACEIGLVNRVVPAGH